MFFNILFHYLLYIVLIHIIFMENINYNYIFQIKIGILIRILKENLRNFNI